MRLLSLAGLALGLACAQPAAAVPAFAVQTGQPCQACHVGGFGPQLTTFGREFKLHGYTLRATPFNLPVSAMAVASYVQTEKDQASPPAAHYGVNDNGTLDQMSVFIAGGWGAHLGAFIQNTYDGVHRSWTWDNLDIRATTSTTLGGADVLLGASLNNNPMVQDAWNTTPAWSFPYTTSSLAPAPATAPLLSGAFAQKALGLTGYAWINSTWFVEAGAYMSPGAHGLARLGADLSAPGNIHGLAPYGRIAFQKMIGDGNLEVGAFALQADIYPGLDASTGRTDRYTDAGLDASYQRTLASGDVVTFDGRYIHEKQALNASYALTNSANSSNTLDDYRINAAYYWKNKIGANVGLFSTTGSSDAGIYAANRTLKPDSSGAVFQLDYTPWGAGGSPLGARFNMRVGLQYTMYDKFNGARNNWDGAGAKASDNNTLRLFTWLAY